MRSAGVNTFAHIILAPPCRTSTRSPRCATRSSTNASASRPRRASRTASSSFPRSPTDAPAIPADEIAHLRERRGHRAHVEMGYLVRWDGGTIAVAGAGDEQPANDAIVDAQEAGTVARFGAAVAALGAREVHIDGAPRMRTRPMATLVIALRTLGATVDAEALPLTVRGPLAGGEVDVPGHESSQFVSALLLVGARMRDGLRLRIAGPLVSAPFVDLTLAALESRGVRVERPSGREVLIGPQRLKGRSLEIPGDVTAATYPAAAAAILGGWVTITNARARVEPGGQGDARFFELIEDMGCSVARHGDSVTVRREGALHGIVANVMDCSDTFPTLAVIATQADTPTELTGIAHTRAQESDRVAAVAAGIAGLGGWAEAYRG